jgi:hypothetical protein
LVGCPALPRPADEALDVKSIAIAVTLHAAAQIPCNLDRLLYDNPSEHTMVAIERLLRVARNPLMANVQRVGSASEPHCWKQR